MTVMMMSVMRGISGAGSSGITGHQACDDTDHDGDAECPEGESWHCCLRH